MSTVQCGATIDLESLNKGLLAASVEEPALDQVPDGSFVVVLPDTLCMCFRLKGLFVQLKLFVNFGFLSRFTLRLRGSSSPGRPLKRIHIGD
jgi:hypothetical protein